MSSEQRVIPARHLEALQKLAKSVRRFLRNQSRQNLERMRFDVDWLDDQFHKASRPAESQGISVAENPLHKREVVGSSHTPGTTLDETGSSQRSPAADKSPVGSPTFSELPSTGAAASEERDEVGGWVIKTPIGPVDEL